jgi:hypothetical protein
MSECKFEYKIRPLIKADQRRISAIFGKLVDKIDDQSILNIIQNTGDSTVAEISDEQRKTNIIRVFMEIFKRCVSTMHDEIVAWFADLIGVTVEQYDQLPIDIDVRILEQIKGAAEVENFFTGALRLYSGTAWFKATLRDLKGKYDSIAASLPRSSKN